MRYNPHLWYLLRSSIEIPLPCSFADATIDLLIVWLIRLAVVLSLPESRLDNFLQFLLVERLEVSAFA